jgi:hypothetical protein
MGFHISMHTLIYMFAEMFRNVAFDGDFQWNTIISVLILIEKSDIAISWNHTNNSIRISEDFMEFLLKKGYYRYFMSGNISNTITKEDITLRVFLQFSCFYKLIDILISLFYSNAVDDKYHQNIFRYIAVSKVFNLVGEKFLKDKLLRNFLFEKSLSLFCNKYKQLWLKIQVLDRMNVSSYEHHHKIYLIQIVSYQFLNGMKKFVDTRNTNSSRSANIKYNKILDYEMDHILIPDVINN